MVSCQAEITFAVIITASFEGIGIFAPTRLLKILLLISIVMKKSVISLLAFSCLLAPVGTFAREMSNFQKKLSCKATENIVRVYLLQEPETLKCHDYLSVLNTYLRSEYQSMLQIMTNLNR